MSGQNQSNIHSASKILRGYFYQFDKTILELLSLSADQDIVTVEDIEDIDLKTATETTAIQCKYYEGQEYFPSKLREPLCLMLDDFVQRPTPINYRLYIYFKDNSKAPSSIDVSRLKSILTFKEKGVVIEYHNEKGLTDLQLQRFLDNFSLIHGMSFDEQYTAVIQRLKIIFNCSKDEEVDYYYYNNSLRCVISLAGHKDKQDRTITKSAFIKKIDHKNFLFNEWYFQLKTKKAYIRFVREQILDCFGLKAERKKVLFISHTVLKQHDPQLPISSFIQNIVEKSFKARHTLYTTQPWTIILDASAQTINEVKTDLLEMGIRFNDGFESIKFMPRFFNDPPYIYREKTYSGNAVKDTIESASFYLRLISYATFKEHMMNILDFDSIFHTSFDDSDFHLYIDNIDKANDCRRRRVFGLVNLQSLSDLLQVLIQ